MYLNKADFEGKLDSQFYKATMEGYFFSGKYDARVTFAIFEVVLAFCEQK